jgi:magnesium transporter
MYNKEEIRRAFIMIYVIQLEHNHQLPKEVESLVSEYLIKQIADNRVPEFESLQDETIFSFQYLHGADSNKPSERIIVSLRDNDIVFLCRTAKTREALIVMTEEGLGPAPADAAIANPDKVLQLFLSEMIRKDFVYLESLEDRITETENALILAGDENARTKIIEYRKELRRLKKYVEALDRILQGLYENENKLMTEEMQAHFKILNRKMDRVLTEVQNLHDYVSQLREAYQAQIDIEQNNLMKVFTIVATIFMPLTLLVGWYGMNLKMPEFQSNIAYPIVAVVSVLVFVGGMVYFKKKKWL